MKPIIILDNGHGVETPGKRSPMYGGKQLMEYEFNRDVVQRIATQLLPLGIVHKILVPELSDISLQERCRRANAIHDGHPGGAILISVHANAGGGTGWECFTSVGRTKADAYANILCEAAKAAFPEFRMRFDTTDGDLDKESQFYILAHTKCPAVLTENFFMDTEKDLVFIMSESGRQRVADMHVTAIKKMLV